MTETTIPFQGQTSVLDRPLTELDVSVETGGGNRGKLLALGGVAGLLVLAVLGYFLIFAGGDEPAATGAVPSGSKAVPPAGDDQPAAAKPSKSHKLTGKTFGRDPFKALITEPEVTTDTSSGVSTSADTSSTTSTTTGTATSGGAGTGTTTAPVTSQPHRFKVVDVAPDNSRITVKVDGQFYRNLKAGEVFARYFKVRFIGGPVNDFQYGEESFKVLGTKAVSIG
jgi:hypothetical protein